jgi:hypothetical protein
MGAAAGVMVGQVIVAVLVSKAATIVAQEIGLGDNLAGLVGMGAGIYAGGMAGDSFGAASTGTAATSTAASNVPGTPFAAMEPGMTPPLAAAGPSNIPGTPLAQSGSVNPNPPANPHGLNQRGGMLSEGTATTPRATSTNLGGSSSANMALSGSTGSDLVSSGVNKESLAPTDGGSWWDKLMSSDKTIDLAVAGMGGYSAAGIAKGDREYDEDVRKDDARDWVSGGSVGINKINRA